MKQIDFDLRESARNLISELYWLINETEKHQTVDTLAKKFYLISGDHKELFRLKKILTIYFLFEQSFNDKGANIRDTQIRELPDKRYDSFIASIIDNKIGSYKLPDNLKIITWNYDLQFELSYREYQRNNITQIQKQLQILPSRFSADNYDIDLSKFALIHLNGIAGIGKAHELSSPLEGTFLDTIDATKPLDSLIDYYSSFDKELPNDPTTHWETEFLNYSWEVNDEFKGKIHPYAVQTRNKAVEIMKSTDILVVIGYSFPFFNRGVDKLLIRDAKFLKAVYVQDQNAADIRDQMRNSFERLKLKDTRTDIDIKIQTGVNQFLIPYEFEV